ncbi:MAG: PspC domain-containing protein [Aerococcus sp.]|nr:PspC domain-containing protein [Aerococcus sp.]
MKRFTRSTTNRILAGVCGGIGEYLNIDPRIIRLFVLILLVTPIAWAVLLGYVLMALFTPQQVTPWEEIIGRLFQRQNQRQWTHSHTTTEQTNSTYRPNQAREAEHVDDESEES